jgi:aldose 1-epimerase
MRSGEQITIELGRQRAVVATVGATLREYAVAGWSVLDGFLADEVCPGGRGQILAPWPNRIADGRYSFDGHHYQLPLDEPKLGHSIHGLSRWGEWHVEHHAAAVARLRHRLPARPGYPFELELAVQYQLTGSGLAVDLRATNVGTVPCPFGAGAHPYFGFPGTQVDDVELCVRAEEWLEVDERSIPRARQPVAGSALDFRRPRRIGDARLDHAYTGLERDAEGLANVLLRHGPEEIRLWLGRPFDFVQIYTGDTLPDRARRRHSVAIEPMTCAANSFNSGEGLRVLAPDESMAGRFGVGVGSADG